MTSGAPIKQAIGKAAREAMRSITSYAKRTIVEDLRPKELKK